MPSLMPGVPGAKEAYGISVIRDDLRIKIPPKAFERYGLSTEDRVVLTTMHRGESGFALLNESRATETVFKKYIDQIDEFYLIYWFLKKAYVQIPIGDMTIRMTPDILRAFHLKKGDRLLVIKGALIGMSFTLVDIWKTKFAQRGLHEAIANMEKLEIF
ncbi:hypothetical protein JXB12_05425 [candidate division KSB1 bacterium]|nr:hypothetical protein [candidate division KSB1 bacterium]